MTNQITTTTAPPRYLIELERDPALRSHHTRRQYGAALTKFESWLGGRKLTRTITEEYISRLQRSGASKVTVKQSLAVIRWWARRVIKIAFDELPQGDAEQIELNLSRVISIPDPKGSNAAPLPAGRHLEPWEVNALIAACDDGTPFGVRDSALIATSASTATRNEELRSLLLGDIKYTEHAPKEGERVPCIEIKIRHGKGDKARIVNLFGNRMNRLTAWIELRGVEGDSIFTRIYKNGRISTGEPLSYEGTRRILAKRFSASALSKHMTWHDFRRTAVGRLFDNGEDISTIMTVTGHTDEKTVRRYDRRPGGRRESALKTLQEE